MPPILKTLGLSVLLATAVAAQAATLTVTTEKDIVNANDGLCSLREAILSANGNVIVDTACGASIAPGSTIKFAPSLNLIPIVLTKTGAGEDSAQTGDLDLTGNVIIQGNGPGKTKIYGAASGFGTDRVFDIRGGAIATLNDLTVRHGGGVDFGAGIRVQGNGTLNLNDVDVIGNQTDNSSNPNGGGGIYSAGFLSILGSSISNNNTYSHSTASGGGLMAGGSGSLSISNSLIDNNQAVSSGGGGIGGGFYIDSTYSGGISINGTQISGNKAAGAEASGGGAEIDAGSALTLVQSEVSGNTAQGDGSQGGGGGLELFIGGQINNVTFSGNKATSTGSFAVGGGLVFSPASAQTLSLTNDTFSDNQANNPPGKGSFAGGLEAGSTSALIKLADTLIAGNSDSDGNDPDCAGGSKLQSQGYNLIGNNKSCGFTMVTGDQIGTPAHPIDAQLAALADNGGRTQTMALKQGSPAIDAGDPNPPGGGGSCESVDQRGVARPIDGDGDGAAVCDIGAYEAPQATPPPSPPPSTPPSGGGGAFGPWALLGLLLALLMRRSILTSTHPEGGEA